MLYLQHGDVLLKKINSLPEGLKELKTNVIMDGKSTGHAHRLDSQGYELYEDTNKKKYLRVIDASVGLTHEEHKRIEITEGDYEITQVREYDPFEDEIRAVQD